MSVSQPNLTIELTKSSACTSLLLADITGIVGIDNNTDGYGISNGPGINDVVTVTAILTYNSLGTDITFVFAVTNGVITGCTLTISEGTPADILSQLTSTVWPFTQDLPFDFFGDYGVSIPDFADEIFSCSYTIEGTSPDVFSFIAVKDKEVLCSSQCCVDKKFLEVDWSCACSESKNKTAMHGQSLINKVKSAVRDGDLATGLASLAELKTLCSEDCGC